MALRCHMEIAGRHRRVDGSTRGDGTRYRPDDRGCDREPDGDWRDRRFTPGDRGAAIVLEGYFLVLAFAADGYG